MNDLQQKINKVFINSFGNNSLKERHNDILNETIELTRSIDIKNLKEETGDLLCSVIQSCSENGWTIEEVIDATLEKIKKRKKQYNTLGKKKNIAIYGGAFDMIHNGHINVSKTILSYSNDYDEVWITPCYKHLFNKQLTDSRHRLEMCKLASQADARIKIFDYEIKNKFQGETYHFVKKLLNDKKYKDKYSFSLIIGLDNANTINKWSNYQDLLNLISFIVVKRKNIKFKASWCLKVPHRFIDLDKPSDISSTYIRNLISKRDKSNITEIKSLINEDVYKYIINNNLYI